MLLGSVSSVLNEWRRVSLRPSERIGTNRVDSPPRGDGTA